MGRKKIESWEYVPEGEQKKVYKDITDTKIVSNEIVPPGPKNHLYLKEEPEPEFHSWNSEPEVGILLNALIRIHECKEVLEVGTFHGLTTQSMKGAGANITTIDIEDHRKKKDSEINFILGDSTKVMKDLPKRFYDLIFIDSFHDYAHVMKEFKQAESLIKVGGLICFHDSILIPDVTRIINFIKSFRHFEVITLRTPDIEGRGGASGISIVKCNYK